MERESALRMGKGNAGRLSRWGGLVVLAFSLLAATFFPALASSADSPRAIAAYDQAARLRTRLESKPEKARSVTEYREVIHAFVLVFSNYPNYRNSPVALAAAAQLYEEMARTFSRDTYYESAIKCYRILNQQYPQSEVSRDALYTIAEIYRAHLNRSEDARRVYAQVIEHYPDSRKARDARERLKQMGQIRAQSSPIVPPAPAPLLPANTEELSSKPLAFSSKVRASSPGLGSADWGSEVRAGRARNERGFAEVTGVRCWEGPDYVRVILTVSDEVTFTSQRIDHPDRLVFDLQNAELSHKLLGKSFALEDGFLRDVRVGQFRAGTTRAVLDVKQLSDYSVFSLPNPFRLVIDIHGKPLEVAGKGLGAPARVDPSLARASGLSQNRKGPGTATAAQTAQTQPVPRAQSPRTSEPKPAGSSADADPGFHPGSPRSKLASPVVAATSNPATRPPAPRAPQAADRAEASVRPAARVGEEDLGGLPVERPAAKPARAAPLSPPGPVSSPSGEWADATLHGDLPGRPAQPRSLSPSATTETGSRTLTRALGLKISRIVIDPGHGGHDTGTIGPHGLLEKDVVLDVAMRLRHIIEKRTGAEVVMTRSTDTFIPLEERTAIANQKDADLFISIHANASHDDTARGIETYYLNFTTEPHALEVAARENATSGENVHQLQTLIQKIALTEKVKESQDFAADVQRSLYAEVVKDGALQRNRGVKRAPFVVLIGANMPSILAEISFITNPRDERNLRKPAYRENVAEALFRGIERYTDSLGGIRVAQKSLPPGSLESAQSISAAQ